MLEGAPSKGQIIMASNDNNNGKEKKEVMQSNLPLLFANGSPISLESMNLVSTYLHVYMSNLDNYCR